MSIYNSSLTFSPEASCKLGNTRLQLLPCTPEQVAVLDDQAAYLHDELCYHHEASKQWVELPDHLQSHIDSGHWDREIAILQTRELIQVSLEVSNVHAA